MPRAYQSPEGRHRHVCRGCNCVWEHADDVEEFDEAHTCPQCGSYGWVWRYTGPEMPAYYDHHLAKKED